MNIFINTNHHDAWLVDPVYRKCSRTAPSWHRPEQTAGNAKLHLNLRWGRLCEWGLFLPLSSVVIAVVLYLTVEVGWNETQFLLGRAVVEEQPFTLSKGVERLQRGPKVGLLSNELVGSLLKLATWHNSMHFSMLSTWNLSDGKKSSQSWV